MTTTKSLSALPPEVLQSLSPECHSLLTRFLDHQPETVDLSSYPTSKLAAVLILLYEKSGQIRVLLTTRAKSLRSHPGQTALPGGKYDSSDADLIATAFREAEEEVALPRDSTAIHVLCTLRPFLSLHKLLVTPVVALLTDISVLDSLRASASEVERIFEHPLEALLKPEVASSLQLVSKGSEDWPYKDELYNTSDAQRLEGTLYRMHRFRSTASPVKGLTADILIMAAEIAYGRNPSYDRWAVGQMKTFTATMELLKGSQSSQEEPQGSVFGNGSALDARLLAS